MNDGKVKLLRYCFDEVYLNLNDLVTGRVTKVTLAAALARYYPRRSPESR
ncbi:MAG: hypothetical protein Kow0080_15010 [Candidatus Promineifilaceae bacterium]